MNKLFTIVTACLFSFIGKADFEGLPLVATNFTWASTRTIGVVSQLFEAVQERCLVVPEVAPLSIVEDWTIQDGYSNTVQVMTWGTNSVTWTNRMPHYLTIRTTNQIGDISVTISNSAYATWFVPLQTNNPSATTNVTLSFPVTHAFVTTMDDKMFEMTPYFVNTNFAVGGKFDTWFRGDFCNPTVIDSYWLNNIKMPYEQWGGIYTTTKKNYDISRDWPFAVTFTRYWGYPQGNQGQTWDPTYGYLRGVDHFYYFSLPDDFPMLSKAGVMKNASIGFVTNLVYDIYTNVTGGQAYFTRTPANTNSWNLWQAVNVKRDTVTLSGSGVDDTFGYSYDGVYVKYTFQELHDMGWNIDPEISYGFYRWDSFPSLNPYVYMRGSLVPGEDFAFLIQTYSYTTTTDGGVWVFRHGPRVMPQYPTSLFSLSGPISYILGTNIFEEFGLQYTSDSTSPLISSNSWLTDGSYYWWYDIWPYIDTNGTYGPVCPPPVKPGCTTTLGWTNAWEQKTLSHYDYRFYNPSTRPVWKIQATTNVSIAVSAKGYKYQWGNPDTLGSQTVVNASENLTLTTNTPVVVSPNQWYYVEKTQTTVTGWAPLNSTILLVWTNNSSYETLPFRLYATDINERVKYLQQLLWTTHDVHYWTNQQEQSYSGSWIEEGNWSGANPVATKYEPDAAACAAAVPPDPNYRTYEEWLNYGGPMGIWFGPYYYSGYIYSNALDWTNAQFIIPGSFPPAGEPWLGWLPNTAWTNFVWNTYAGWADPYFAWDEWVNEWMYSAGTTVSNDFADCLYSGEPISTSDRSMHHTRYQDVFYAAPYRDRNPDAILPWDSMFELFYPWFWEAVGGGIVMDPMISDLPYSDVIKGQTWDGSLIKASLIVTNIPTNALYGGVISHDLCVYVKTNNSGSYTSYAFVSNMYGNSVYEDVGSFVANPFVIENLIPSATKQLTEGYDNITMTYYGYAYTNLNQYFISTNWGWYTNSVQVTNDVVFTQRCVVSRYSYRAGFPDIIVFEGYTDDWQPPLCGLWGWIFTNSPADPLYGEWLPDPRVKRYGIGRFYPTGYVDTAWTNLPQITAPYDTPGLDGWIEVVTNVSTYTLTNITQVISNITWISSYTDPRLDYDTPWPNTSMQSNSLLYITTSPPYNPDTTWWYTNLLDVCKTNIYWVGITWYTNELVYTNIAYRDYYGYTLDVDQDFDTNVTASIHTDHQLLKWNVTNGFRRK